MWTAHSGPSLFDHLRSIFQTFQQQLISAKNNTTGFKYRVKYKSLQKFIWKNKLSPILKTQEKDFHQNHFKTTFLVCLHWHPKTGTFSIQTCCKHSNAGLFWYFA